MNTITRIITELHDKLVPLDDGVVADYIPELALVDPDRFGIALTTADGHTHLAGDTDFEFTIQSVSKAFVYGLVLDAVGVQGTETRVDLEPSGDAFNEISLDPVTSKPMNAMINAGAIAVTGLVPGEGLEARFGWLRQRMSAFAGRPLDFDEAVYRSERDTGHRNRAIAHMLRSGGIVGERVEEDLDLYFRQCSLLVDTSDLALMGATLAYGGINPISGERVLSEPSVERVLSVMASSGMYNWSGSWITQVGLPAKSGVGGGIVAVLPGQLSIAVYSPRLDAQGNSVRGIEAFRELSKAFNLHVYNTPTLAAQVIRRSYRLSESGSTRRWPAPDRDYLQRAGSSVAVIEVQGDLFFAAIERLSRAIDDQAYAQLFVVDCSRIGLVDPRCPEMLADLAHDLDRHDKQLILVDPNRRFDWDRFTPDLPVQFVEELDVALEGAEFALLRAAGLAQDAGDRSLSECDLFADISHDGIAIVGALMEQRTFETDDVLCRAGDAGDSLFVLTAGTLDVMAPALRGRAPARIASVSPGACLGEVAVVDGEPRSADVVAGEPSRCHVLTREALRCLEEDHPALHGAILRNILLMNLQRIRRGGGSFADRSD